MRWYRTVLVVLIALGLLAGVPDIIGRLHLEGADNRVELVADEQTFVQLAQDTNTPIVPFFQQLKAAGVNGIGVSESTLSSLEGQGLVTVVSGVDWVNARRSAGVPEPSFTVQPNDTYVLFASTAPSTLPAFVAAGLSSQVAGVQQLTTGGHPVVAVPLPPGSLLGLPLGFAPGAFQLARQLGMDIVPRPNTSPYPYNPNIVSSLVQRMASAGPVHSVLFAGASTWALPGYPSSLDAWAAAFRKYGWRLGLLETPQQLSNVNQPGTSQLSAMLNQNAVRVYSVPTWMLADYSMTQTEAAVVDSVRIRNLRLVYLHPYTTGSNDAARTVQLYSEVASTLRADHFQLSPPHPIGTLQVSTAQRLIQAVAAVAAGLLLLTLLWPSLLAWGWWLLGVLGVGFLLINLHSRTLGGELTALGASVSMAGLAVCFVANLWNRWSSGEALPIWKVWARGVAVGVITALITFVGAAIIGSVLGNTIHMIEWEYFRGVKITYLGVPLIGLLAFTGLVGLGRRGKERPQGMLSEVQWVGDQPITYRHVAAFLVLAAIFGYYLLRSGNVSASLVLPLEAQMRLWLQRHLIARPREKDFLVGYPSIFMAVYCAVRRWRWPFLFFLLGTAVGQVSIVDAFEHLRTPFVLSMAREGLGMAAGMITGTLGLFVIAGLVRLWESWHRRPATG